MEGSVFISYSHADARKVQNIAETIKRTTNMTVWYDSSLRGGENYFSAIANQIVESKFFIFIVSGSSIRSDWCLRELEFAASERKAIVAIWLENIPILPRVKLIIQNTHYINYDPLSADAFADKIRRTFLEDRFGSKKNASADEERTEQIWSDKYFLDADSLERIDQLLSKEKQNKYTECFQGKNAFLLGLAYEMGIHVEADPRKAEFYYKISDYKEDYDGKYLYAAIRSQRSEEDAGALLAEKEEAAAHGSIYALTYLGDDYYFGRNGCEKNREKAYAFWKQAADAGSAVAMYCMAYGHRWGECVKKDPDLACMYALMATEYGFPRAYRLLAFMYEEGELQEKNAQKAIELFEEAIRRGDYLSLCYEGSLYGELEAYDKRRELYEAAVRYAESGKVKSGLPYFGLGFLYKYGEGVEKNLEKAVEYYLLGAERKYKKALEYTVSTIMEIRDPEQREAYLLKAYELGCSRAAYELGTIEKERLEGNRRSEAAVRYFTSGAENGDAFCASELIFNYSVVFGNGKDQNDRAEALRWFQFFFANADETYMKRLQEADLLATYYYAYAIELDYDPDRNMPDREFVQLYFQKSLDSSPKHLIQIASFAVNGYLFPEESSSGLITDVPHAVELLSLVETHLEAYYKYLLEEKPTEALEDWESLTNMLVRGYQRISECFQKGDGVSKDKAAAKQYKAKAQQVRETMDQRKEALSTDRANAREERFQTFDDLFKKEESNSVS